MSPSTGKPPAFFTTPCAPPVRRTFPAATAAEAPAATGRGATGRGAPACDDISTTVPTKTIPATVMTTSCRIRPSSLARSGTAPAPGVSSEIHLNAQFEQARVENLERFEPIIAVSRVDREDGARVQHVINVEHALYPASARLEGLRQSQVELIQATLELGLRSDDVRDRHRALVQIAFERGEDLRSGHDVVRAD